MLRLKLEVTGFTPGAAEQYTEAVHAGLSEGIQRSGDKFATDVRAHTPVLTGRAKRSVYVKPKGDLAVEVGYDKDVRWYMKIVEITGAKPHEIPPRGNKLQHRSRARSPAAMARRRLYYSLVAVGVDQQRLDEMTGRGVPRADRSPSGKAIGFLKLALKFNGRILGMVHNHPGVRSPVHVIRTQLESGKPDLVATVYESLHKHVRALAR